MNRGKSVMPITILTAPVACEECAARVAETGTVGGDELCKPCSARFVFCIHCETWIDVFREYTDNNGDEHADYDAILADYGEIDSCLRCPRPVRCAGERA